jgi:fatty acid desaturase
MTVTYTIPKYTEQVIPERKNLMKSLILISLVIGIFFLSQFGVSVIDRDFFTIPSELHFFLKWVWVLILGMVNGILVMGLGILGHEAAHKGLFKNPVWNDLCGGIFLSLLLIPFYSFKDFHLTHHRYTHIPEKDPEEPVNNHSAFLALTIGPLIGLGIHYKTVFEYLFSNLPKLRSQGWKDVLFISLAGTIYFYLVPLAHLSVAYTVFPLLVFLPFVFMIRNVSEHHGIPAQTLKSNNSKEDLKVDSWMILTNPLMDWLWSNINYHQVHHRYPYLHYCYLPEVFAATKDEHPYVVIKGYLRAVFWAFNRKYYGSDEDIQLSLGSGSQSNVQS